MRPESAHDWNLMLVRVVQDLAFVRDQTGLMQVVKRAARQMTGADGVTFVLRDGDRCHYVDEDAIAPLWKGRRFPATSCISGWSMIHREVVVIPDIYLDERIPQEVYRATFVRSLVMVPVRSQDPIAAIGAYWADRHEATREQLLMLQALADTTAIAFDNVQLLEAVHARATQSEQLLQKFRQEEERRERLEEQLRHSQRLEAIGRLAGAVAHDFNNILTVISGYAEIGPMSLPEGEGAPQAFEQIRKASDRASELTRQLLAFSRHQPIEPGVQQINAIVTDLGPMLRRLLGTGIELKFHLADDLGRVRVDRGQIEQAVVNLVVNSRDAMPSGGTLTIETANVGFDESSPSQHLDIAPGDYAMLAVSDNGHGMDETTRQRLFEPYFSTKPRDRGTGLGLATVYGIVKQSGGNIWVYSEPDCGATFKIYLPRTDLPLAQPAEPQPQRRRAKAAPATILLVEDDASLLPLLRNWLRSCGHEVLVATCGDEAIELLSRHGDAIDVVVSDLVMPGMSGGELGRRIAAEHPSIKLLYVSGFAEAAAIDRGQLAAGAAFLQKPFTPTMLAERVGEMLAQ